MDLCFFSFSDLGLWGVDDIYDWAKQKNLGKDICDALRSNEVDGSLLCLDSKENRIILLKELELVQS